MHFIPIVNQVEKLLPAALEGCQDLWEGPWAQDVWIVDNRHVEAELAFDLRGWVRNVAPHVEVVPPPVSLTTAQTMNFMLDTARALHKTWFTWQHLDAVAQGDSAMRLQHIAKEYVDNGTKWGMLLTNHDALAACNVAALTEIGGWDWLRFPFYFLDNDVHHRLELAGYPIVMTGLPVQHLVSQTIQDGGCRQDTHEAYFEMSKHFFKKKWPGVLRD
jgi:hypothetical protein